MKHVKLNEEAHRIAKVAAAEAGMSLTDWLAEAIQLAARPRVQRDPNAEPMKDCECSGGHDPDCTARFIHDAAGRIIGRRQ